MPHVDPVEKRACQKRYRDKNKDSLNAKARAQWNYRRGTPEKWEAYKAKQREKYAKTREYRLTYAKAWKAKNWRSVLATQLKVKFNLPIEEFDRILEAQGNRCLVCKSEFSREHRPHVDHCHSTGRIRGLLCRMCNGAEGFLKTSDNARRMYEFMLANELLSQSEN